MDRPTEARTMQKRNPACNATHVGVLFPGDLGFEKAAICATLFTKIEQAFLDRSLDKLPQDTKGGAEMAELLGKAQLANKTLADVQHHIAQIISLLSQ